MADGSFPGLVSRDRNTNAQTNAIWVRLSDDTNAITLTGTSLNVNVTNTVPVSASDLDIRNLVQGVANDRVTIFANTVKDGTGTDYIPVVDSDGNLQVDVLTLPAISFDTSYVDDSAFTVETSKVTAIGALVDETTPDSVGEGEIGIPRMTADRKLLIRIVGSDDADRLQITDNGEAKIDISAQSLTAVKISKDSSANTETNPIFVKVTNTVVSGSEIHHYEQETAITSDLTSDHDYPVAGTTFLLKSVIVAASGNVKFEVKTGPIASLVTKAVGFLTGRQGDSKQIFFDPPVEVPAASTGTVRITITNRQGAAMDAYSTIIGNDVP